MITRFAILAATAAALTLPAAASAAPATSNFTPTVSSGVVFLPTQHMQGMDPIGLSWVDLQARSNVTWDADLPTLVGWNTDNLRQGANLAVSRMAMPPIGHLKVSWTITGKILPFLGASYVPVTEFATKEVTCAPRLMNGTSVCTATSPKVTVVRTDGAVNSPHAKVWFTARFTITGEGAIVTRNLSTNGVWTDFTGLSLDLTPKQETVKVPCGTVGAPVNYALDPYRWTPAVAVKQQPITRSARSTP